MAETDEIVLIGLRSVGVEIPEDTTSVSTFDSALLYLSCVGCLHAIQPGLEGVPPKLPQGSAGRFKACTIVCQAISANGYPDELGFNDILYTSPTIIRKILSWLVSALPAPDEAGGIDVGPTSVSTRAKDLIVALHGKTVQKKTRRLRRVAMEECQRPSNRRHFHTARVIPTFTPETDEEKQYIMDYVPFTSGQPPERDDFPSSIMEWNQVMLGRERDAEQLWEKEGIHTGMSRAEWERTRKEKAQAEVDELLAKQAPPEEVKVETASPTKKSRFQRELDLVKDEEAEKAPPPPKDPEKTDAELAAERRNAKEAELAAIRERVQALEAQLRALDVELGEIRATTAAEKEETEHLGGTTKDLGEQGKEYEQQYENTQKTLAFADDVVGNRKKLEEAGAEIRSGMEEMTKAFEAKEDRYKAQYSEATAEQDAAKRELQRKLDEIKSSKGRMKMLIRDIKDKEEQKTALEAEYAKLPKNIDRDLFIRRIMDIIKNIKKQQLEVTKINIDNKELQKEINQTNDAVSRSFIATEEKIYKSATQQDLAKKVYKQLVALRENFDHLVSLVEECGAVKQAQHDLEEKRSAMANRNDGLNMERLEEDLEAVRTENVQLAAEVKALKRKG